jgi:hypothetical protein
MITDCSALKGHSPAPMTQTRPSSQAYIGKLRAGHGGLSNAFGRLMGLAGIRTPLGPEKRGKGRQFSPLASMVFVTVLFRGWLTLKCHAQTNCPAFQRQRPQALCPLGPLAPDESYRESSQSSLRNAIGETPSLR